MHASWVSTWEPDCELQMKIQTTTTAVWFLPETLSIQGDTFKFWECAYYHCSGELKREEWQHCVSHRPILSSQDTDKTRFTFLQIQLRRFMLRPLIQPLKVNIVKFPTFMNALGIFESSWWNHVWAPLLILQTGSSYFSTAPTEKVSQQHHLVFKISNWQSLMRLKKPFSQTQKIKRTFSTI